MNPDETFNNLYSDKDKNYRYYVSNWFIPRGQIALNLGPITIIKKDWFNKANAKTKAYILRHQYIHYQQWLKDLGHIIGSIG